MDARASGGGFLADSAFGASCGYSSREPTMKVLGAFGHALIVAISSLTALQTIDCNRLRALVLALDYGGGVVGPALGRDRVLRDGPELSQLLHN